MKTVKEMVKDLGTVEYVAVSLRVTQRSVYFWMANNVIGRESRMGFLKLLKKAGYKDISLKDLNDLKMIKKESV